MPVILPPGRLRLVTRPIATGSVPETNTMGIVAVAALAARPDTSPPMVTMTATPADDKASFVQSLAKDGDRLRICSGRTAAEESNHRQATLLSARRERPRRRAAEQRDELAPPDHSITSSAQSLVLCWSPKLRKPSNREHTTLGLLCEIVHTIGPN